MKNIKNTEYKLSVFGVFVFLNLTCIFARGISVFAGEAPCALIEAFDGEVQIMDAGRVHLRDANPKVQITCGSWVSVIHGWVRVRHQNGYRIQIGNESFVQFPEFYVKNHKSKGSDTRSTVADQIQTFDDHVVLYRGQLFAEARDGAPELRIITPVSRARLRGAKALFISREGDDEAQLISLRNSATLENRFEPSHKMRVQAGEATSLNFKLHRVIPTSPRAVSVAALKSRIYGLFLSDRDRTEALRLAVERQNRKFASELPKAAEETESHDEEESKSTKKSERKLAGVQPYQRNPPEGFDPKLHQHWVKKMVGGEAIGEQILYPDKFYGKSQKVQVQVEEPKDRLGHKLDAEREIEKKKLMEELSRIHIE